MISRVAVAILLVFGVATAASGAAYDDFAAGVAAYVRGDFEQAIASLNAALAAPDLAPNLKMTAYLDRARSYVATHRCSPALMDANSAKAAGADGRTVTLVIAAAQYCARDFKAADASFTSLLEAEPEPDLYFIRGRTRWAMGSFAGADSDFAALNAANPDDPYAVVWMAVAEARQGNADRTKVEHAAVQLNADAWPMPVISLYLGKVTPEDVTAAAAKGDAKTVRDQQCEANFYLAEWQLAKSNPAAARPLLKTAMDNCPKNFVERDSAEAELAHLE